ncbi:hypothetical protein ABG808_09095 [Streptococcus iniae]
MPTDQDYRYLAEDSYNIDSKLLKQTLQEGQIVGNGRYIIVDKPVDNTRNGMHSYGCCSYFRRHKRSTRP